MSSGSSEIRGPGQDIAPAAQPSQQVTSGEVFADQHLQPGGDVPPVPIANPTVPLPVGTTALTPSQMAGQGGSAFAGALSSVAAGLHIQTPAQQSDALPSAPKRTQPQQPPSRYRLLRADQIQGYKFRSARELSVGEFVAAPACNFRRIVIEKMNVGAGVGYEIGSLPWLPVAAAGWLVGMVLSPIWALIGLCRALWIKTHPLPGKPPPSIGKIVAKYAFGIPSAIASNCKFWPSIITTGGLGLLLGGGIGKAAGCRKVPYGAQVAIEKAAQNAKKPSLLTGPVQLVTHWPACAIQQFDYGRRDFVVDEEKDAWYFADAVPEEIRRMAR